MLGSSLTAITGFLQAISVFYARDKRRVAEEDWKKSGESPAVTGHRKRWPHMPLEAYQQYEAGVERGFILAAKFLHTLYIYRIFGPLYQSQIIPNVEMDEDIGEAKLTISE